MKPLPHQITKAQDVYNVLHSKGICYLAGEVRSGKTYTAILALEKSDKIKKVLVLTKKAAISGFVKFTDLSHINFTVTNYEQINKIKDKFDAVIIDEAHNLGTVGKPSQRVKDIRKVCYNLPVILLSGTAIVESPCSIFHQCCVTKHSPFKHKNFYAFHKEWGVPDILFLHGRQIQQYKKYKPALLNEIDRITVIMTQADAGIVNDREDVVHYVELSGWTESLLKEVEKEQYAQICGEELICDSTMKLRTSLHMIESGVLKIDDNYITLGNIEKFDYLKGTFNMDKDTVILAHYIGEQRILRQYFPQCTVESATAKSEGVDYSHAKEFILFSSGYSGAKFIQRLDRITNINGSATNKVHHILVKGGISDMVYQTVSKKRDFNNKVYKDMK